MNILNTHKPKQGEVIVVVSSGGLMGSLGFIGEFVEERDGLYVLSKPALLLQGIDPRSGSAMIGVLPLPTEASDNILYVNPTGFFRPAQDIISRYIQTVSNLVIASTVPKNEA